MKICDSSYLIAFLHPKPEPPQDRQGKPVTRFKERIEALIADLSAADDIIGIPTPALAETLVRSGPNRAQYMKVLGDTWKFQMLPFDARAAIDTADLIAAIKTSKEKWDTWAKVKFDIQIVATAKSEGVSLIYSDDHHIETYAKRFNIRVMRICDLPLPPDPKPETEPVTTTAGSQMPLNLSEPASPETPQAPVEEQDGTSAPECNKDGTANVAEQPSDQLKADPPHPPAVQGSNGGRAQSEAPSSPTTETKESGEAKKV